MTSLKIIEQVVGALLMALVLLDAFLTVLYARVETGIISTRGRVEPGSQFARSRRQCPPGVAKCCRLPDRSFSSCWYWFGELA